MKYSPQSLIGFRIFHLVLFSYLLWSSAAFAQPTTTTPRTTTPQETLNAIQQRDQLRKNSLVANLPARNIGPNVQGGRIVDIDVLPEDEHTWYVAYASGGLFRTTNNGQSFDPLFDNQGALGIGDFAIAPSEKQVIYIGTGENNSSRSSYAGAGIYRSVNGGASWEYRGLAGTQHIGRVIVHPKDHNTVWVAAIGPLYTDSNDRGIYKTSNGGQTWTQVLQVETAGAIDLVIDPSNPDVLYASFWERSRKAYEFDEDGPGSGIYKSTDGGKTWNLSMKGIPQGEGTGRIGLAISSSQPKTLYAFLDNQETDPALAKEDTIAGITSRMLSKMNASEFLALEPTKLDSFLKDKGYPSKYKAAGLQDDVETGKITVKDIADYFGDANDALFNTAVKGAEVYRSDDAGQTWFRTHEEPLQGVSYTYGYYFGQVRVAPDDPDRLYITGVPVLSSEDGGKNWARLDTVGDIHVDHHELWINPRKSDQMLLGNDGGLYATYDRGVHWTHLNNLPVGQFYTVMVDNAKPYNVYGGTQDNGVLKGSSQSIPGKTSPWKRIFGGDGMFIVVDNEVPDRVYTGFQFGNYYRLEKGGTEYITPQHDIASPKYRFNWRTPLVQSPHNHEILYMGSQFLMRSLNRGEKWEEISTDLTSNYQPQGNVPYSTLTTIAESPLKFGLIWTGSDDGRVNVTTDGGNTWDRVDDNGLPQGLWVGQVFASTYDQNTAFVTLTGYRNDDFHAYVYKTTDLGKNWSSLQGDLPEESVNVIVQDPVNPDLFYLGTDQASYISLNAGQNWNYLGQLPNVASYDMMVHPRENELVIATHGRSIYVLDVKPLQNWKDREEGQQLMVYDAPDQRWRSNWGEKRYSWSDSRTPKTQIDYIIDAPTEVKRQIEIVVRNSEGKELYKESVQADPGFNRWTWDLNIGTPEKPEYPAAGDYEVEFKMNFEKRIAGLSLTEK